MFLLDARAYAACGLTPETQVLAAVSGGSDSTALLLELHRLVREGKIKRVAGAHINHGIRDAEAQRDEAFVWRLCRRLEIENFTARVSVPAFAQRTGMSLEHAAREMRYKHLRQIKAERGFDCIAVAHHQSDQAETILQHAIRGCGLNGLVGMKTVSGDIVRPLLDVSKAEILAFLAEGNHPFLEDSTNMEPYAQRNRLRQRVIPELVRENPQAIEHLCRTASFLAEDEAYLTGLAKAARTECGENRKAIARLPKPVRKRVLMALLAERDVEVSADTVMRLDELLLARTGVRIPLSDGFCAWTENDNLRLGKLSELETYDLPLEIGQVCALKTGRLLVTKAAAAALPADTNNAYVNAGKLAGRLRVRNPRPGDRFSPLGLHGSKLLSDYFTDRKVGRFERINPLVCDERGIVFVTGHTIDERARITDETREILHIKYIKE